jgi:hypothetical protein
MKKYSSLIWFLIGIYVCLHAYKLGVGKPSTPGPGFIFFLAAAILIMLSFLDLFQNIIKNSKDETGIKDLWKGMKWQRVVVTVAATFAYIFCLSLFGFFISTFLLMIVLYRILEPNWWITIAMALVTSIISYVLFIYLLKTPFPVGFMGI